MSDEFFLAFALPSIFLLVGIVLLASAAYYWTRTRALLTKGRDAVGKVVALEIIPPQQPGADEYESYAPIVMFKTAYGQDVRFTSLSSSYPAAYAVGDRVPVLYTPDGSEAPRIRSFHDLWFLPAVLATLGLIFTVLGGGFLLGGVPQ